MTTATAMSPQVGSKQKHDAWVEAALRVLEIGNDDLSAKTIAAIEKLKALSEKGLNASIKALDHIPDGARIAYDATYAAFDAGREAAKKKRQEDRAKFRKEGWEVARPFLKMCIVVALGALAMSFPGGAFAFNWAVLGLGTAGSFGAAVALRHKEAGFALGYLGSSFNTGEIRKTTEAATEGAELSKAVDTAKQPFEKAAKDVRKNTLNMDLAEQLISWDPT